MAPKKAAPKPKGTAAQGEWMSIQRQRLQSQAKALGKAPHSVESFAGAAYYSGPEIRPRNVEELRDSEATPVRSAEFAARQLHRRSEEAQLFTSFEPQRHVSIVCGRPVQVLGVMGTRLG